MIGSRSIYRQFIFNGLRDGTSDIYKDVQHQAILGDNNFVARIRDENLKVGSMSEQPVYRNLMSNNIAPDKVFACVVQALGMDNGITQARSRWVIERCIIAELLFRYSGLTQKDIGIMLGGVGYSAVSMMRHHLMVAIKKDSMVKERFERVEREVLGLIEN